MPTYPDPWQNNFEGFNFSSPALSSIVYGMSPIELPPSIFVEIRNMTAPRHSVLVASRDSKLADVRKTVLEDAGFEVVPVTDLNALREACEKHKISLIMIGYSLPPSEKRRIWDTAREVCNVPILELYENGKAELIESHALFTHESRTPEDFLSAVIKILNSD